MLYDIIRETRAYREMTKDSHEQGLQEGKREGLREGLRETLLKIVQARFPDPLTLRQAKGQAAIIEDPEVLQDLIVKVSLAQTAEEAQKSLLDWSETNKELDKYSDHQTY